MEKNERKDRKSAIKEEKKKRKAAKKEEKKALKEEKKNKKNTIKKEKKDKKKISLKIVVFVLVASTIVLGIAILLFVKYQDEKETYNKLMKELNEQNEILNSIRPTLEEIVTEEEALINIDDQIKDLRSEVYKLTIDLEKAILAGKTKYKIAYLTFDDGPYYLTHDVIAVLKKKRVKATFFTIGLDKEKCFDNRSANCSIMYKKIVDNGHTIANHTYSHLIFSGLYNSVSSFIAQVDKQEKLIKDKTGVKTSIVRFPGGSNTAGYLKNGIISELRKRGYGWVDWSAQDGDGGSLSDTTTAWNNLAGSINENIEVVLFHDYNRTTYAILPDVIDWLESKNYIILPLTYDSVKVNK